MANVRAKFRCVSITQHAHMDAKTYTFQPMYDTSVPEDQRYAKYTPSGRLEINVDNPNVDFKISRDYYLDFTLVEDED